MDQRGNHIKINFEHFQTQKWFWQTGSEEKVDEENGVICLVFMYPSCVMVLKFSKSCISPDFRKKSRAIMASERYRYGLSQNGIAFML